MKKLTKLGAFFLANLPTCGESRLRFSPVEWIVEGLLL